MGGIGRFGSNLPGGCFPESRRAGKQLLAGGCGGEYIPDRIPVLREVYRGESHVA